MHICIAYLYRKTEILISIEAGLQLEINTVQDVCFNNISVTTDEDIIPETRLQTAISTLESIVDESGNRIISDLTIANISNITIDISGSKITDLFVDMTSNFNWPSFDNSGNIRLVRDSILDIIFEQNTDSTSFITSKQALGILNDDPDGVKVNKDNDFTDVEVFSSRNTLVNIDYILEEQRSAYFNISNTKDAISILKSGYTDTTSISQLDFIRIADGSLIVADYNRRDDDGNIYTENLKTGDYYMSVVCTLFYIDCLFTVG